MLRISYNNFFIFPLAAGLILLRRGRAEPELASPHFDEESYQVEMEPAPPLLNSAAEGVGKVETALLRRISLPFGTSIIAIAEKAVGATRSPFKSPAAPPGPPPCGCRATRTRFSSKMSSSVCVAPCCVVSPPQ